MNKNQWNPLKQEEDDFQNYRIKGMGKQKPSRANASSKKASFKKGGKFDKYDNWNDWE
jgi:hypothetical protein